jgi:hypothetical protein
MRKLLSLSLLAALTTATAGCECYDCFARFEAWKNQTLFGSGSGAYAPYAQYGAPAYDCGGVSDCGGMVVQSPCAGGACAGGACAPAPQGVIVPGQTVITPGQTIVPGATVVPGPEHYAPAM